MFKNKLYAHPTINLGEERRGKAREKRQGEVWQGIARKGEQGEARRGKARQGEGR